MNEFELVTKYESIIDSVALDNNLYFVTDEERKEIQPNEVKKLSIPILGIGSVPFEIRVQ
jgi:hypothetical protein